MKVCITSKDNSLESEVDPRFGRCRFFLFVDTETNEFEALSNPNAKAGGGAGVQAAQLSTDKGAKAVLSGSIGPNAFEALNAAGVEVYNGVKGSVKGALETFVAGGYERSKAATVQEHHGMS